MTPTLAFTLWTRPVLRYVLNDYGDVLLFPTPDLRMSDDSELVAMHRGSFGFGAVTRHVSYWFAGNNYLVS